MDVFNSASDARETAVKIWDVRGAKQRPSYDGSLAIVQRVLDVTHPHLSVMIFDNPQESRELNWEILDKAPALNNLMPVPLSWNLKVNRPVVVLWQDCQISQN